MLLSGIAYTLIETIRRLGLAGTEMARAQAGAIRLKLLKIGAVIVRNSRRVRVHLSSACPDKALFMLAAERLAPGHAVPNPSAKPPSRQTGSGARPESSR
ncbi:MAG: transposase [Rhodospirillales bacterium]